MSESTDGLDLVRAYQALKRLLDDERTASAHLRASLEAAIKERDVARRCLAEHADCDEEECRAEIEAALGANFDPIEAAAEQRGYIRGRSEQRAADVAALRDGQIIAYDRWLAETGRIDDGSACILDGRDLWSVSEYLESLPVAGGEGPETP